MMTSQTLESADLTKHKRSRYFKNGTLFFLQIKKTHLLRFKGYLIPKNSFVAEVTFKSILYGLLRFHFCISVRQIVFDINKIKYYWMFGILFHILQKSSIHWASDLNQVWRTNCRHDMTILFFNDIIFSFTIFRSWSKFYVHII